MIENRQASGCSPSASGNENDKNLHSFDGSFSLDGGCGK
jgi:hypothetical protein